MYALYPLGILLCKKESGSSLKFKSIGMKRFIILNVLFGLLEELEKDENSFLVVVNKNF